MRREGRPGGTGREALRHHTLWGGRLSLCGVRGGGAARARDGMREGPHAGRSAGGHDA